MSTEVRPNILVFLCDQLRPFELGCYGHRIVETPNIDDLALHGIRFEYACSSNPLCSPARSSLVSGQYSRSCMGMLGNVDEPKDKREQFPNATLPELLQNIGYETVLVGKWHIDYQPQLLGFNRTIYPKVSHKNVSQTYFNEQRKSYVVDGFAPDYEVKVTENFLKEKHEKPFFLFHNLSLPHMPYADVSEEYRMRYSPHAVHIRPNAQVNGKLSHDEEWFKIYMHDYLYYREHRQGTDVLPDGFDLRTLTAHYYGMIASVDEQIGRIMNCLQDVGLTEDTIVVFLSDHGDNLGSHGCFNKHSVNDEAIRIPLIVSWTQRLQPAVVSTHVASLVDIAPTLLSLVGEAIPEYMQGRNLVPLLTDPDSVLGDDSVFIENIGGEIAVRTPSHLYVVMTEKQDGVLEREVTDESCQFFDLRNDPYQLRDLAKSGEQQDTTKILREKLLDWNQTIPWMSMD